MVTNDHTVAFTAVNYDETNDSQVHCHDPRPSARYFNRKLSEANLHHEPSLSTDFRGQNHAREQTQSFGHAGPGNCAGVNAMVAHPGLAQKFGRRGKRRGEREKKGA